MSVELPKDPILFVDAYVKSGETASRQTAITEALRIIKMFVEHLFKDLEYPDLLLLYNLLAMTNLESVVAMIVSVDLPVDLLLYLDDYIAAGEATSRQEAILDAIRFVQMV